MKTLHNSEEGFSSAARLVLFVVRWIMHDDVEKDIKDLLTKEAIEWERFKDFIIYHELAPLAYICLKRFSHWLPNGQIELLKKNYYSHVAHLLYLEREFLRITRLFNDRGIEFLPLKGMAFLVDGMYADKKYLRPMCDVDLLIKKRSLPLAEDVMMALGYEKSLSGRKEDYWKKQNYHLAFIKKRHGSMFSFVEIHWALDYKRNRPVLPDLWNRVQRLQIGDKEVRLFSQEETLFSLALHGRRFGKPLSLKNICDAAMLLNVYKDVLDWGYILKEAQRGRMRATLYFLLLQANLLLEIEVPPFVLKTLDIAGYKRRLMKRFILQNTFASESFLNKDNLLYLKSHFLIYDNILEPIVCTLNVPQEQFAKFYRLQPYARKTRFLYKIRYFFFLANLVTIIFKAWKRTVKI